MNGYIKPSSCDQCPAAEKEKQSIRCGCMRNLSASINNYEQKLLMWNNCPLGWKQRRGYDIHS